MDLENFRLNLMGLNKERKKKSEPYLMNDLTYLNTFMWLTIRKSKALSASVNNFVK